MDQSKENHPEETGLVPEVAALSKGRKYFDHRVCRQGEVNLSNCEQDATCFIHYKNLIDLIEDKNKNKCFSRSFDRFDGEKRINTLVSTDKNKCFSFFRSL